MQERQRLARDLHDSITQLLFSVSLLAQSLVPAWRKDPVEGEARAERLVLLSRSALMKMRTLVAELMLEEPPPGDGERAAADLLEPSARRQRLRQALLSHAGEICGDGPVVELDLDGYAPLPAAREEVVYRIAQEALNNAVKHAHATHVLVRIRVANGRVHLVVRDDGRGFRRRNGSRPEAETAAHGGLGLLGMRERVEAAGGLLLVTTRRDAGTTLEAILPLEGTR
jgi:signal transduction histidine kinase